MTAGELISLMQNPALLNQETLPVLARLTEEYPCFQTARMLYVKNLSRVKDSSLGSELKKMAFYAGDARQLFYLLEGDRFAELRLILEQVEEQSPAKSFELIDSFLKGLGEEAPGDYLSEIPNYSVYTLSTESDLSDTPGLKNLDIIDSFLQESEKDSLKIIPEEVREIQQEEEKIPEDTPEDSRFFSETLAKIYIKQKKYDKAMEIIQNLSLLYPEKSVYFADQIRFLEKLIINAKK